MIEDLSSWPNEAGAAAQLQVSIKTIQRYGEHGKVEVRKRPRPGKKPENIYNPIDIDRLKATPLVLRPERTEKDKTTNPITTTVRSEKLRELSESFLERLLVALERPPAPAIASPGVVAPSLKPWLTIQEAVAMSGLSQAFLRSRVREGKIFGVRGGRNGALRIHRASLEAFGG